MKRDKLSATVHQLNLQDNLFQKTSFSDFLNAFAICDRQNINVLFGVLDYKYSIFSYDLHDKSHSGGIGDNQYIILCYI